MTCASRQRRPSGAPRRNQRKTSRSSSYTPYLRGVSARVHGYLHAASSDRPGQVEPDAAPVRRERLGLQPGEDPQALRVALEAAGRRPPPRPAPPRRCARTAGGRGRAPGRRSRPGRGRQPSALPSSRPIWAHSSEWVSRVRGKSLSPGTTTWVLAASRRSADECSTRARSRSYAVRPAPLGRLLDPPLLGGRVPVIGGRHTAFGPESALRWNDLVVEVRQRLAGDVAELGRALAYRRPLPGRRHDRVDALVGRHRPGAQRVPRVGDHDGRRPAPACILFCTASTLSGCRCRCSTATIRAGRDAVLDQPAACRPPPR